MEVFTMAEKVDFHVKADKAMSVKAKELSGMTNRQLYELGCKIAIEQNRNRLDAEILEINELMDRVNELQDSILELLKDKEVPTKPDVESDPDDDDFRRGRPSCHKKFGEDIALLAGDALQALAFKVITNCKLDSDKIVKAVKILSDYIGVRGMVGGQVIDLQSNNKQVALDVVLKTYELKTAALIQAACTIGAILGGANEEDINKINQYAYNLGIAFQIKDDILDVIGNSDKLGKPIGSDEVNNKSTYLSFVGLKQAQKDVLEYSKKAKECICKIESNTEFLNSLVDKLIVREN